MPPAHDGALSDALDRLYGTPLEEFVAVRQALAAELKSRGETAAAQAVMKAAKPSRTAWAINQIARRHPGRVKALLETRDAAAAAQRGTADEFRAATQEYRAQAAGLVHEARDLLEAAGAAPSAVQVRRIAETLNAAGAGDAEARAQLVSGRLVKDVELENPFASVGELPERQAQGAAAPGGVRGQADGRRRAAEERREKAQERAAARERERRHAEWERARGQVAELEGALRSARAAADDAAKAAARAHDEARRARNVVDEVQGKLETAREKERALR